MAQIERFQAVGGVRLEDDVLITETGVKRITVSLPPDRCTASGGWLSCRLVPKTELNLFGIMHAQVVPRRVCDVEEFLECGRKFRNE